MSATLGRVACRLRGLQLALAITRQCVRLCRVGTASIPVPGLGVIDRCAPGTVLIETAEVERRQRHTLFPGLLEQQGGTREIGCRGRRLQEQSRQIDANRTVPARDGAL